VTCALLLALASAFTLQGAEVTATVDRTRLAVGEELMLTVRARTRSALPLDILLPPLAGFAIVGSRDLTEVAMSGTAGPLRTTVRELQLRAEQAGAVLIGPVRVRQGESRVATEPILITVDSAATGVASALSPLVRALLETAPPPRRADDVALTVIVPDDTVLVGQQMDLIAAAWVPRALRERMRRPPILTFVTPQGVWAYPPFTPAGVAAARSVGGRWMDLFITHQIVFPLAAGRISVAPASVDYAVPVTFSFFSREERYTLRSDSLSVVVLPLPATGRPAGDRGVVGQGLTLDLRIEPAEARVGEPLVVAATVGGVGNVALWPEPVLRWPPGFRSYPAETEVRLAPTQGRIAGSKTFRFLAVPDSAGGFVLPDVRYDYFDVAAGRYQSAVAAPRVLAVAPGAEPRAARALPPLLPGRDEPWADRLGQRLGVPGWLAVALLPPLIVWVTRRRRGGGGGAGRDAAAAGNAPAHAVSRLGGLEHEFLSVLASHVPDAFARDGDGLAQALRAAGVDSAVADHVKRLRDRLRAARYGPRGLGDAAELAAEIQQVLRVLGAESAAGRRHRIVVALWLLILAAPRLDAQAPSAEALYEAGALRAAADSFAARAAREPNVAAHWYNLGATLYRAGADGKATAALTVATRLAPRDAVIRRARRLLPAPDLASEQLLAVGWATPAEWALLAGAAWGLLWLLALTAGAGRRRQAVVMVVLGAVALGATAFGATERRRQERALAVVVAAEVPVRAAPYGGASAAATVHAGAALVLGRRYGRWVEVRRPDGMRGWVLAGEIVPL
jgi:SH3 domain-containing protein/oxygen tolerance protein BatD